jgi:branched-chain amino acid aminotransferase
MEITLDINIEKTESSKLEGLDLSNIPFGKIFSDHMFFAKYEESEWKNPRILPYQKLKLSPANSAIHYGQSIFEGMKAFRTDQGKITLFRPHENLKRFNKSAERMCMPLVPEELFIGGLQSLIDLDRDWVPSQAGEALYVRPFMFAMDDYIGIRPSDSYYFLIFSCPVGAYYSEPVRIKIETRYTRAVKGGTGFAKAAGNYAASLYPSKLAREQGFHQLLWTDGQEHRFIEESGTMNIIFIIDGKIKTPPVGETILKGVTRDSVLVLARDRGMEIDESPIEVAELVRALENGRVSEAFGTGTAATIAPVEAIGFEDRVFDLNFDPKTAFSTKILDELEAMKRGRIEDRFDWNMTI